MSDTPITDALWWKYLSGDYISLREVFDCSRNLERQLAEAREQVSDLHNKWLALGKAAEHLGEELHQTRKQRDVLAEFISKNRDNAISIQKIRYGWDGDCGANKFAEYIEEDCDLALANLKGDKP